eukprot:RCo047429
MADADAVSDDLREEKALIEKALRNPDFCRALRRIWAATLGGGEPLFQGRMSLDAFLQLTHDAGLVRKGKDAREDALQFSQIFSAVVEGTQLDFLGFVRCLGRIAMYKHDTEHRIPAMKVLVERYLIPFAEEIWAANTHDGLDAGPKLAPLLEPDGFVMLPEVDRLLLVYARPLEELFE